MNIKNELESQVVQFVWAQNPDLAIEAGYIPSRLWEDVGSDRKLLVDEEARSLDALAAQVPVSPMMKAALSYHIATTNSAASTPAICMLNHMTGPIARLSWAAWSWPLTLDPSCELYTERLTRFTTYCGEVVRAINADPESTAFASRAVLSAFMAQVDAFIAEEADGSGFLFRPMVDARMRGFQVKPTHPDLLATVLTAAAALRRVAERAAASAQEASPFPRTQSGSALYAKAIYSGTSLNIEPHAIEELGYDALQRSDSRFRELLEGGLVSMDCASNGAVLMDAFQAAHSRLVNALPAVSAVLPTMRCDVAEMPNAHAAEGPPAYYGPSSFRNSRNGTLYVNIAEPVTTRNWEILPLAMHEGVPGHHLQLAILDENPDIPDPLRLLQVNAFTEGWAVYAETLSSPMGIQSSPAEEFGLLAHQRWRAARLVVDVGLHVRGWSVDQAATFMSLQTGQEIANVRREVIRYLSWPGQALGYSLGAQAINSWIEGRIASGLSLRDAHAELLSFGSIPLSGLASAMM